MRCSEVIALLDPLIDDELTDQDQTNLTAHIDQCSNCEVELADMRKLQSDLKEATIFSAPDSLQANIQQEIIKEKEGIHEKNLKNYSLGTTHWAYFKSFFNLVTSPAITHAGAVLLGAVIIFFMMDQSIEITQQPPAKAGGLVLRTKVRIRVTRPVV